MTEIQVLTLLSGKGGSGKTIIGMSMAKVLAEIGKSVLLVDCDFSTHGATYFFEDALQNNPGVATFEKFIANPAENSYLLEIEPLFFFMPYTARLGEAALYPREDSLNTIFRRILTIAEESGITTIILDCQAGVTSVLTKALEISTRNLVVLEPDAISTASLRALHLRIGKFLRRSNTWQIFNKITDEERPIYEQIHGGSLFPNLSPLPFDWQVRAAFARAEIPGLSSNRTSFGLGITRIMRILFKPFAGELKELEDESIGIWYASITGELRQLKKLRRQQYLEGERSTKRSVVAQTLILIFALLTPVLFLLSWFWSDLGQTNFLRWWLLFGVVAFSSIVSYILIWFNRDIGRYRISSTFYDEPRISSLQELLVTDPILREYGRQLQDSPRATPDGDH